MGRIKASGEHRHVHQVLQLPLLEALDQKITIFQVGRPGHQGGFVLRQVAGDLPRMLHRRREDHHALALSRHFHHLLNDGAGHPLVLAQQLVDVLLGILAKAVLREGGEIVLRHRRVHQLGLCQIAPINHVA